jgi:hypothetical protein
MPPKAVAPRRKKAVASGKAGKAAVSPRRKNTTAAAPSDCVPRKDFEAYKAGVRERVEAMKVDLRRRIRAAIQQHPCNNGGPGGGNNMSALEGALLGIVGTLLLVEILDGSDGAAAAADAPAENNDAIGAEDYDNAGLGNAGGEDFGMGDFGGDFGFEGGGSSPNTCKGLVGGGSSPNTCKGLVGGSSSPNTCKGLVGGGSSPNTCKGLVGGSSRRTCTKPAAALRKGTKSPRTRTAAARKSCNKPAASRKGAC